MNVLNRQRVVSHLVSGSKVKRPFVHANDRLGLGIENVDDDDDIIMMTCDGTCDQNRILKGR